MGVILQKPVSSSTTAKCHLETSNDDFKTADSSIKHFGQWEVSEWHLTAISFSVKTYGLNIFQFFTSILSQVYFLQKKKYTFFLISFDARYEPNEY